MAGLEWTGHWEKEPWQNPDKDPKPSMQPGPGQIPEIPGFGHSKETLGSLSQHPGMRRGCVENPRTGFHVLCWEKWENLWNPSRNAAAVISWEIILELDLGAVPTFHNCPTNPRALPG